MTFDGIFNLIILLAIIFLFAGECEWVEARVESIKLDNELKRKALEEKD